MGFFKDFKEDLSQAVNELLPDDNLEQEDNNTDDEMINTLDMDKITSEEEADNAKMMELLEEFAQSDKQEEETATKDWQKDLGEEKDFTEQIKEEEGKNMEDNVDLELLEALNSNEETELEEEKSAPKLRASSVLNDNEVTVIAKGTTINGSISSDGSLDIMGNVTGDVECLGKLSITGKIIGNTAASEVFVNTERMEGSIVSEGSVKVGLGTVVIGDVTATSGVIAGAIKGEIDINGPIVIDSTAIIKGNIKAKSVQINNGAVIEGFCSLSYSAVDVDNIFE